MTAFISAPPSPSQVAYELWNRVILDHCLLRADRGEKAYLAISPNILVAAWEQSGAGQPSVDDAETDFIRAVSDIYKEEIQYLGLQVLKQLSAGDVPLCVGFLALSVLAAHRMRQDNAYYTHLADLLKCDLVAGLPKGFDVEKYVSLWNFLGEWLRDCKGIELAEPIRKSGPWYIVGFPLIHVPLRQVDLKKLPYFFTSLGYQPGTKVSLRRLEADFKKWIRSNSFRITPAGRAAIEDERCPAVISQIVQELELWDGSLVDVREGRIAGVDIQLDILKRQPHLFYLPRRPSAFPAEFDDGHHKFESYDEGWYDPVAIPREDGPHLANGFTWQMQANGNIIALRRPAVRVIAMAPSSEYSGFISRQHLPLGVSCTVLCHESIVDQAARYLTEVSDRLCEPQSYTNLPIGWKIFLNVKATRRLGSVPAELEPIDVEATTDVTIAGGLKVGRRRWIAGAPPNIFISGISNGGQNPKIDGTEVSIDEDGMLLDAGLLARTGFHEISLNRGHINIEIVEPDLSACKLTHLEDIENNPKETLIVLPPGSWTIIGASYREVAIASHLRDCGLFLNCKFKAVWAISNKSNQSPKLLCLTPLPIQPKAVGAVHSSEMYVAAKWVSAILSINNSKLQPACLYECSRRQIHDAWKGYVRTAHAISIRQRIAQRSFR